MRALPQHSFNAYANISPVKLAQSTSQWGNSNGLNIPLPNFPDQIAKARLNILYPALGAPVALGGKVDDIMRVRKLTGLEGEHAARAHLPRWQAEA